MYLLHEPPVDPPVDEWFDYHLPAFIENKIMDICENILKKGENTTYYKIFDLIYEHIQDHIEDYYSFPEVDYE